MPSRFPSRDELAAAAAANVKALAPVHVDYLFGISVLAVSLQLSTLLAGLCRLLVPRSILDLGSGFSTYVFRAYAAECDDPPRVVTVDDSSEWLEKSQSFLVQTGLAEGELVLFDDFLAREPERFDLVLHDLGGDMIARAQTLVEAVGHTARGGVAVLDDVDWPNYRNLVERAAREARLTPHDLSELTLDETGRFAWALERA